MEAYKSSLSEPDFNQLENLLDQLGELNSIHAAAAYIHGCRTGAIIMNESSAGENESG